MPNYQRSYRPPQKTPQQKQRDLIIALTLTIGLLFLVVLAGLYSRAATPDATYTVVTPDDSDTSYTGGTGSSTSWVYGHDTPLPTMAPTTAFHYGVNHNPWGYDFTPGQLLYSPVPGFCAGQYFQCVTTFWEDSGGYVVECHNGLYSHSGGVQGACSRDGGVWRPLYSH